MQESPEIPLPKPPVKPKVKQKQIGRTITRTATGLLVAAGSLLSGDGSPTIQKATQQIEPPVKAAANQAVIPSTPLVATPLPQPTDIPLLEETKEAVRTIGSPILEVDFASYIPSELVHQRSSIAKADVLRSFLEENYLSEEQLESEFGKSSLNNRNSFLKKVYKKYPEVAVTYGIVEKFENHGLAVAGVMQELLHLAKIQTKPELVPLQYAIHPTQELTKDKLGNTIYWVSVNSEEIIEMIKDYPTQDVVNISAQVGKVGFVYKQYHEVQDEIQWPNVTWEEKEGKRIYFILNEKGQKTFPMSAIEYEKWKQDKIQAATHVAKDDSPEVEVLGAYTKEFAEENVQKLISVCRAFPHKLFFAAAGNWKDDLREVRVKFARDWPENLVIVGEWEQSDVGRPKNEVYGADIYVDNALLYQGSGSSLSTPGASIIAALLHSPEMKNLSISEVKKKIFDASKKTKYSIYDLQQMTITEEDTLVFDPVGFIGQLK